MCIAKFLSPVFDEDDVGNATNLTNVDVNRQSTRTTDIQVFFHTETVLSTLRTHRYDQDSSISTSAPELSRTSPAQQARDRRSEYSLVCDGTLILTEIGVCVVWHRKVSTSQPAVSFQEDPLSIFLCWPSW